jgi:hypothetical protein
LLGVLRNWRLCKSLGVDGGRHHEWPNRGDGFSVYYRKGKGFL